MLGVFDSKLKTDQTKEAIRKHTGEPFAAQLIYKDVKEFGEKSTSADIAAGKLLGYISNIQLGSPQLAWTQGYEAFIRHFNDKLREYEQFVEAPLAVNQRIRMLQNAVRNQPVLAAVAATDRQLRARSGDAITYESYYELLLAAAQEYDDSKKGAGKQNGDYAWHTVQAGQPYRKIYLF